MNELIEQTVSALGYIFIGGIIFVVFNIARGYAENNGLWVTIGKGFLCCVGIAIFTATSLGGPSCVSSEYDSMGSVCTEYADDGYIPSSTQKTGTFAFYFTFLFIPLIAGAYIGKDNYSKDALITKEQQDHTSRDKRAEETGEQMVKALTSANKAHAFLAEVDLMTESELLISLEKLTQDETDSIAIVLTNRNGGMVAYTDKDWDFAIHKYETTAKNLDNYRRLIEYIKLNEQV